MKWFKDLKIMKKLLAGFILVALLAGIIGLVGIVNINKLHKSDVAMFEQLNAPMVYITTLNKAYYDMRIGLYESAYSETESNMKVKIKGVKDSKTEIAMMNDFLDKTWLEKDMEYVDKYKAALQDLYTHVDKIIAAAESNNKAEALSQLNSRDINESFSNVELWIDTLINSKITSAKVQSDNNGDVAKTSLAIMISIMLLCVLASIGIGVYISFMISKPLQKITKVANKIALGEVDEYEPETSKDEVGDLSVAFSNMIGNISEQAIFAEKIANGDLDLNIVPKSEEDVLSNSMNLVINTLNNVLFEIDYLLSESKKENYRATGDVEKFSGTYRSIIEGVNNTFSAVSEKIFWYEEILDSIQFPISVTDLDMKMTYVNKAVESLLGVSREELMGKHCSCWNTENCNTENCAIERFKNNESRTVTAFNEFKLQADCSPLYNSSGNITGQIEVLQDITQKSKAVNYQKEEVKRLSDNLKLLAQGNLTLDLKVAEGDEDTIEERKNFEEINENVSIAVNAISDYIKDITVILNEMAKGNLNVNVMSDYKGDFVEIKNSLNAIIVAFNNVVNEINTYADQVAIGSRQVSNGSQALSQGTTEQASSVEELTASITQVASQTKQNAMNANQANELAIKVKNNAANGAVQMQEMLGSMEDINSAFKNISKIIKVIDEIAFQTNILALNASVEAARAGQYGKGFAVVAEEVRNLAARSAKSVNETTMLIEESFDIAAKGTKKAKQTSDALNTIVEGIDQELSIVGEIAKASDEQANAITQINRGIEQVSKVVQNNSSTAEEGAAASEELSSHADVLKEVVGKFRTTKNSGEADKKNKESAKEASKENKNENKKEKSYSDDVKMVKINLGEDEFGKY